MKQKILMSLFEIKPPFLGHPAISIVAVETKVYRFNFPGE
jgi:hypothetical protein